uniref:Fe2OG dioxygenase domain-containing protein n=1 Tax=Coccolithus braarudii TaxID=221442 RepID=A0A7S0Q056_9EUKA|mmetsp:Transcript_279/g.570  ORF Transcript_279/g.570 Transcript_279/m.570 type:complete len:303 (+) Transcript_279:36-944(+)
MCTDELPDCATMAGLFSDTGVCRWPTAELCLRTCGECPRVAAARACRSLSDEGNGAFGVEHVDWRAFFEQVVQSQEEHGARLLSEETPWLAEFPTFLSPAEADEMIRIGEAEGLHVEDELPAHIRNVSVANCDSAACIQQPFINELSRRVSDLLQLPSRNFESNEFVRYEVGGHYRWHPDEYSWSKRSPPDPVAVLSGPRVLTFFMYLSDVEEGGQTAFSGADLSRASRMASGVGGRLMATPRKGKAILWANMQSNWRVAEPAAVHTALPVREGVKWAATIWVHASGFRIPEIYAGSECRAR